MNYESKVTECLGGIVDIQRHVVGMQVPGETLGERVIKSDQVQDFISGKGMTARVPLTPLELKTAILSTSTQNDPLVNSFRPDIAEGARRRLMIRDLLRQGTTDQAAVEYPTEASFTNNAGVQVGGSPEAFENVNLGESGFTFSLSFKPVVTLGHFIHVSKQVLEDSGVLDAFLRNRLLYGLRLEEEDQILNGTGANGQLDGLLTNATSYSVQSPSLTNEVDILVDVIRQIQAADYSPDAIVLNPQDWYDIRVRKEGSSSDTYVAGAPQEMVTPRLWGLPVVITNSIASGTALVGDFTRGAALFDRQEAAVELSRHNDTVFQKNMITLRAVLRVSVVVTSPLALVKATI
jgi:HK97 family phage major capsid protein